MSESPPGISVLMTAYNAMPYLESAVDSILKQTYSNFEFVIVNDGSVDGTQEYLNSVQDPRIRVFHEINRGTAGASNFGLSHCNGKYVARMDADDVSMPTRLEKQFEFMESNPEVSLVGTQTQLLGEKELGMKPAMPLEHDEIFDALKKLNHGIAHGSCMYRNRLIQQMGGYWDTHRTFDDWDMFLKMGEVGRLANLPELLYQYRLLAQGLVGSRLGEMRQYYWYAIECSERRTQNAPPISFEDFIANSGRQTWLGKKIESLEVYALNQYRISAADLINGQKLRGYSRLILAASCSPTRTLNRVQRTLLNWRRVKA